MAALFRMGLREPVIARNETREKEREKFEPNIISSRQDEKEFYSYRTDTQKRGRRV